MFAWSWYSVGGFGLGHLGSWSPEASPSLLRVVQASPTASPSFSPVGFVPPSTGPESDVSASSVPGPSPLPSVTPTPTPTPTAPLPVAQREPVAQVAMTEAPPEWFLQWAFQWANQDLMLSICLPLLVFFSAIRTVGGWGARR